ncbi:hypothetical protein D3C87_1948660 [compost metagenome]
MPSPMLTKICFSSVKGDSPIQAPPSPPICVKVEVLRSSLPMIIMWQPMPVEARLPAGRRVETLCGQPEQK